MTPETRIAPVADVPGDSSLLFTLRDDDGEEREAILVRADDAEPDGGADPGPVDEQEKADGAADVVGWLNACQHFTHIRLDKGGGAVVRDGEVLCQNHGAMFETDTGRCTYGPCEGAYLTEVDVTTADGAVYLTDGDFEFVSLGAPERDPTDLTSTSNVEF
jgi:nitrite reductase/ring-hydroxylating ferredoxin subunit